MTEPPLIPYGRQQIEEDDIAAVARVLRGDWLTTGPEVEKLEADLAKRIGAGYAVACASGTAALHLSLLALGIGDGDRVVVPALTFTATASAARLVGAEVTFADVDPANGLMDTGMAEAALTDDVKAVLPVHLNGQTVDMAAFTEWAAKWDIALIEDACHAFGGTYRDAAGDWRPVGDIEHDGTACFSFHPVKAIAMGEGGAVTCRDDEIAARLRQYRNHGIVRKPGPQPWAYEVRDVGLNYRASDIHCALARSQLAKLDRFLARRRDIVSAYDRLFAPLAPALRPLARVDHCQPAWHLYVVHIDWAALDTDRASFMAALAAEGIGSQVHYIPLHQQPYFRDRYGRQSLPGAEAYYASCLSLPLYPAMTDEQVEQVADAVARLVRGP